MSEIDDWVEKNTFACTKLRARITPAECKRRQTAIPEPSNHRWNHAKVRRDDEFTSDNYDNYCRSGQCEQGKAVAQNLISLKRRGRRVA